MEVRISKSTKLKLYNTCILPIFLYGSECWAVTKRDVHKIDALDQWCLRKLLGIKWYHHVQNDDVRRKTEQPLLLATVQARRLSLFGHSARMPDKSDAKRILTVSPLENWRRPSGRPHTMRTDEDYPAGPGITEPLSKCAIDVAQKNDIYVWHYALIVVRP